MSQRRVPRAVLLVAASLLALMSALGQPLAAPGDDRVLRVCEDPNNLPFSNRAGEGFENKIAELFAAELGWKLEYTWFPQRMGFIRNTLRGREPDLHIDMDTQPHAITRLDEGLDAAIVLARDHGFGG